MADAAKKGSMLGAVIPILVLTAAAGGGGALVGNQIASAARTAAMASATGLDGSAARAAASPAASPRALKELVPVVTNLVSPEGASIRLQTAIVYDRTDAAEMDVISREVGDDILAFVRTLSLTQLQGASGLQALRDDLNERAALRSGGKVRELLIEMLVVR